MNLFNQFRETVFLKEDSNLETQLAQLKEIREKIVNKDQIDRDIKFLEIGLQGEKEIAYELRKANIGIYVLHDITLTFENLKSTSIYDTVKLAPSFVIIKDGKIIDYLKADDDDDLDKYQDVDAFKSWLNKYIIIK